MDPVHGGGPCFVPSQHLVKSISITKPIDYENGLILVTELRFFLALSN